MGDRPAYRIGKAAELMGVHPRTLRIYESEGLVKPARRSGMRIFDETTLVWLRCLRELIHDRKLGIQGSRRLLAVLPCWEIKDCPEEVRCVCLAKQAVGFRCWEIMERACGKADCKTCEKYLAAHA